MHTRPQFTCENKQAHSLGYAGKVQPSFCEHWLTAAARLSTGDCEGGTEDVGQGSPKASESVQSASQLTLAPLAQEDGPGMLAEQEPVGVHACSRVLAEQEPVGVHACSRLHSLSSVCALYRVAFIYASIPLIYLRHCTQLACL